jgi:hypothetical protein
MGNSNTTLASVVDYASTFGDIAPILKTAGYSTGPALTIATDVMAAMLSPAFNWKFNRFEIPTFVTNSWQQDYVVPGVANIGWLEHGIIIDINNTSQPKPFFPLEVVRDLERTSYQFGRPAEVCWHYNSQLTYGTWGSLTPLMTGQVNPGPGVVYTNPIGSVVTPANPITQIKDPARNLLVLTIYGTCGSVQPEWPNENAAVGTPVQDGSCVWTVVSPSGQGFRVSPLPPQQGVTFMPVLVGQLKPPVFTSLKQTLDPLPDDFAPAFREGFVAFCYRQSSDARVRAKFKDEYTLWRASLSESILKGDREKDDAGFFPSQGIMSGPCTEDFGPAWPYPR